MNNNKDENAHRYAVTGKREREIESERREIERDKSDISEIISVLLYKIMRTYRDTAYLKISKC